MHSHITGSFYKRKNEDNDMIFKRLITNFIYCLLMTSTSIWANTASTTLDGDTTVGAINPISVQAISGDADGNTFLSFTANIFNTIEDKISDTITDVSSPFEEWSYNRGIGTIPDTCEAGSSPREGLCAQDCPAGYDSVSGVCWQQCPTGYSDTGAFCTLWQWKPETLTKQSWVQPLSPMSCSSDMQNEEGLCYEPCAETFTGIGPLCFGQFGGLADQQRILDQAASQQADALAASSQGGIVIGDDQIPELKTDMSFAPIVCGLDAIEGAFDLPIPDPVDIAGSIVDAAGDSIVDAVSDAIVEDSNNTWFVPSVSQTVLLDFSAEASCEDDGIIAKASLNFQPSVTVQANTRMFDTALHSLTGVDLGIMQVSLYELIPFRIYGTVGTTLGTDTTLISTVDRSQSPVIIDGRQHANSTSLDVIPSMDLWLSSQAYIRITSFLSFIPDLLQVGAEFKQWVMELSMPYSLEEGVRNVAGIDEVYKTESLNTDIESGRGFVNTFLKVLGFDINAFGDEADVSWEGVTYHTVNFTTEEASAIDN
jgi:hypothetical protein